MDKKIFGLFFITVSSFIFSMEQSCVTLESISNQSAFHYSGTYGSDHKVIYSGQKFDLKESLFSFVPNQQFPFGTQIWFNELPPVNTEDRGFRLKVLNLIMTKNFLLIVNNHDLFKKEQYVLNNNKNYIIHVIIDQKDNLQYSLEEKND